MATKKLAFGGMSNAVRAAADKAATQIRAMAPMAKKPQAPLSGIGGPAIGNAMAKALNAKNKNASAAIGAAGMKGLMNQPGMEKRQPLPTGLGGMGAAALRALKGGAPSAGSGPMAAANPLRKIGSGPSRQAMMKKGGDVEESKAMVKKEIGFMKKAGAPKSMIKHEMADLCRELPQ
jgi:hypothetical protein